MDRQEFFGRDTVMFVFSANTGSVSPTRNRNLRQQRRGQRRTAAQSTFIHDGEIDLERVNWYNNLIRK
jgi:hypothetical protein